MKLFLELTLKSDASFGRGDGLASAVDSEIEYDQSTGLPIIKGRTIKGLVVEECANLLFSLKHVLKKDDYEIFMNSAKNLFGVAGSNGECGGKITFGDACLPEKVCIEIKKQIERNQITPQQVLESLTAIRSLTSVNYDTGAAESNSLRCIRVLLHGISFTSVINIFGKLDKYEEKMLSACILNLRRGGSGRNRGRGKLQCKLFDDNMNVVPNNEFGFISIEYLREE